MGRSKFYHEIVHQITQFVELLARGREGEGEKGGEPRTVSRPVLVFLSQVLHVVP